MKYDPAMFDLQHQDQENKIQIPNTSFRCILCNEQTSETQNTHECEFRTNANVNLKTAVLKIKSHEKPIR